MNTKNSERDTLIPSFKEIHRKPGNGCVHVLRCEHHPFVGIVLTAVVESESRPTAYTDIFIPHPVVEALREYLEDIDILESIVEDRSRLPKSKLRQIGERMR